MRLAVALIVVCFGGSIAWAADQPACDEIQHSCGEAGFTRDVPGGKDLMSKCFQPLMLGQDVAGVKVDPDLVKKCSEEQKQKPKQGSRRKHRS